MSDLPTELRILTACFNWNGEDTSKQRTLVAAAGVIEDQQARIDKLGSILTNIVRDDIHHETFSEDITGAEVAALANTLRAALKGTDT